MVRIERNSGDRGRSRRPTRRWAGRYGLGLAIMLGAGVLPLTLDRGHGPDLWKTADAGNHGGGNGGGSGNGGGNGGGNSGGGDSGGAASGGNTATGSAGKNAGSLYGGGGGDDKDRKLLVEQGVALAQFTTRISKRYPADDVALLDNPHQAITFFTEVRGMAGHIITHRWTYGGTVEYETNFQIRGPKWKFWSTRILPAEKAGRWRVEVLDENGTVLADRDLNYQPAG